MNKNKGAPSTKGVKSDVKLRYITVKKGLELIDRYCIKGPCDVGYIPEKIKDKNGKEYKTAEYSNSDFYMKKFHLPAPPRFIGYLKNPKVMDVIKEKVIIYGIYNIASGRIYIGSSKTPCERLKTHIIGKNSTVGIKKENRLYGNNCFICIVIAILDFTRSDFFLNQENFLDIEATFLAFANSGPFDENSTFKINDNKNSDKIKIDTTRIINRTLCTTGGMHVFTTPEVKACIYNIKIQPVVIFLEGQGEPMYFPSYLEARNFINKYEEARAISNSFPAPTRKILKNQISRFFVRFAKRGIHYIKVGSFVLGSL